MWRHIVRMYNFWKKFRPTSLLSCRQRPQQTVEWAAKSLLLIVSRGVAGAGAGRRVRVLYVIEATQRVDDSRFKVSAQVTVDAQGDPIWQESLLYQYPCHCIGFLVAMSLPSQQVVHFGQVGSHGLDMIPVCQLLGHSAAYLSYVMMGCPVVYHSRGGWHWSRQLVQQLVAVGIARLYQVHTQRSWECCRSSHFFETTTHVIVVYWHSVMCHR